MWVVQYYYLRVPHGLCMATCMNPTHFTDNVQTTATGHISWPQLTGGDYVVSSFSFLHSWMKVEALFIYFIYINESFRHVDTISIFFWLLRLCYHCLFFSLCQLLYSICSRVEFIVLLLCEGATTVSLLFLDMMVDTLIVHLFPIGWGLVWYIIKVLFMCLVWMCYYNDWSGLAGSA